MLIKEVKWEIFEKINLWTNIIAIRNLVNERIIKDNGVICLFGTGLFFYDLCSSNKKLFRYELIWEKERPTNIFFMKKQIGKVHENIGIFYKSQPTYNPIMVERKFNTIGVGDLKSSKTHKNQKYKYSETYDKTKVYPRSVIKINRDTLKGALHPTQKPVELYEYLIKTYTNENDIILDNCAGSFTIGLACNNINRNWIGIESDLDFYQIGLNRCNKGEIKWI